MKSQKNNKRKYSDEAFPERAQASGRAAEGDP